MYLCYDVNMWSIYGIDIRLLKEHPEYKEQIKLLPTRWEKVNKIKKECALAHYRACGGHLRHLPYTPQCASSRSIFYFTGKQFPVK